MLKEELRGRIVDALLSFFDKGEVAAVILYGSYAEGRETQYSDIDVLIIINKELSNWREKRRIEVSLRKKSVHLCPLSPRVMTVKEFSSAFENYDPLVLNVLLSGKILYDTGSYEKAKDRFRRIENTKIARTSEGYWVVAI